MNGRSPSLGEAFNAGWAAFMKYPWLAMGGFLIYQIIGMIGSLIPYLGILYMIFVMFPLMGGMYTLFLKIARDNNPRLDDLFVGFSNYGNWMGVGWLLMAIYLACLLPVVIIAIAAAVLFPVFARAHQTTGYSTGAGPMGFSGMEAALGIVLAILILATIVAAVVILIRYIFAYYLVAEGAGIMESLQMSAAMTAGHRSMLFLIVLVLGLFAAIGILGLGIGVIFTSAVANCALAMLYLQMIPREEIPPAATIEGAPAA